MGKTKKKSKDKFESKSRRAYKVRKKKGGAKNFKQYLDEYEEQDERID